MNKVVPSVPASQSEAVDLRAAILAEYDVDSHGMIQTPGRFESEMLYTPYFYDVVMNGCADTLDWPDGGIVDLVDVDDDDRRMFPELGADTVAVAIETSDQGFVSCVAHTQATLDALHARHEAECEEAEEERRRRGGGGGGQRQLGQAPQRGRPVGRTGRRLDGAGLPPNTNFR